MRGMREFGVHVAIDDVLITRRGSKIKFKKFFFNLTEKPYNLLTYNLSAFEVELIDLKIGRKEKK